MITLDTATQLEALALQIFNLNIVPNDPAHVGLGAHFDPTRYTGIQGQDSAIDQQYYDLIAPAMLAIDGRVMETGFEYTLNVTCALKGRAKHWFLQSISEFVPSVLPPVNVGLSYLPPSGSPGLSGDFGSYGFTLGTAMCAANCNIWATIIRMWLQNNYPYAVTQPA